MVITNYFINPWVMNQDPFGAWYVPPAMLQFGGSDLRTKSQPGKIYVTNFAPSTLLVDYNLKI